MQHRPTPRTMDEAFGPGPHHFIDPGPPLHLADRIVLIGAIVAMVVWLAIEAWL